MGTKMERDAQQELTSTIQVLFRTWPALRLAVDQSWGGDDSKDKQAWFATTIAEYMMESGRTIDRDDVAAVLLDVMLEEFNTILEDDSHFDVLNSNVDFRCSL